MKKFNFLFMLLAFIGLATSCSQDDSIDLQNSENNRVIISANLEDEVEAQLKSGLETRASGDLQVSGFSLRYILEVLDESDIVTHREEKLVTDASNAVSFEFSVPNAGRYTALMWADYVLAGSNAASGHYPDLYYKTNNLIGLREISIIGSNYAVNTASRDAFFGISEFEKLAGIQGDAGRVILQRPFGRINVIEKNTGILQELISMDLTYNVPSVFNALDGSVTNDRYFVSLSNINTFPDGSSEKANLFYDYIFVSSINQHTMPEININYTLTGGADQNTIPPNIPVFRNKRTNISGNILKDSNAIPLLVEIDDNWLSGDENHDI